MKRSCPRSAVETLGAARVAANASSETTQMISGMAELPLVLMVRAHNLYGKVTVQVVPASTKPVAFMLVYMCPSAISCNINDIVLLSL